MSLPSVASEPNVVVAPRRPGAPVNRTDDAPAQPAGSFASALDNNGGGGTPAVTGEPAATPGATGQPDQTNPAGKGQSAPASPSGVNITTATAAVGSVTTALDAIVLATGAHVSTDGKVPEKASDGKAPDGAAPDEATAGGTAIPHADSSLPVPLLAALIPVPLVSPPPTPAVAPAAQAGAAAGVAAAGIAAVGIAAAGAATAGAAAALPGVETSTAGKVQGTPEPVESAPDPALVAARSLPLSAGLEPKAVQLLATARTGGDGKPAARTAANPVRGPDAPRAQAAASDAADSSTASLTAATPVQGNSSDPHSDDTGTRKGPHGEADATATSPASAEPNALRTGAAATATFANASAPLAARTDASQNLGAATQAVGPLAAASAPQPQTVATPAAATQVATSYAAAVPLSGLAAEITAQARNGKNRFEIRLDPPDLGRIDVRLDVDRQGQVTSHLVVDRSETLDLLRADAPSLERALQSTGLKTDGGLEFSLRDQSQHQSAPNAPSAPVTSPLPDDELAPVAAAQRSYWRLNGLGSGVDISV